MGHSENNNEFIDPLEYREQYQAMGEALNIKGFDRITVDPNRMGGNHAFATCV